MRFIETSLYEVSINMWALEKMNPSHFIIWITLCDKHNNNRQKIISALRAALFACSVTLRKYACYWNTRLLSIVPFLSPQAAITSMSSYGKLLGYCSIMYMWHINDVVISINKCRWQFNSGTRGDLRICTWWSRLPQRHCPWWFSSARATTILLKNKKD